jgi:hypothetical protein
LPSKSLNGLAQADMIITDARMRSDRTMRRTFMPALIGPDARSD